VLAGAFGVGIGFGLQDVVNNFVCGLILLFERPVTVGDIVEVGGLQGEVRRIGIRASTVRTYQGADIIVPNSQFITANVTNWTLSDQLRRIELPVGVNYGAAPQKVIALLGNGSLCPQRDFGETSAPGPVYGIRRQFDQLRAAGLDGSVRPLGPDPQASWPRPCTIGVCGGHVVPFPQREVRVLEDLKMAFRNLSAEGGS